MSNISLAMHSTFLKSFHLYNSDGSWHLVLYKKIHMYIIIIHTCKAANFIFLYNMATIALGCIM